MKGDRRGNQRGNLAQASFIRVLFVNDDALQVALPHHTHPLMGRSATKSVARVYCDVNNRLGPSWYEYGMIIYLCHFVAFSAFAQEDIADNLQVQWGSQDHYEIVRKVGRGKYSEVGWILPISHRFSY